MKKIIYKSETRGFADHGWLKAKHTFSFANYYNPERMHFGVLRVLNDDIIAPGMGFGEHPHDNMEIITIPLSGAIRHKDSMGNSSVIKTGEIQVMSAGSGVFHSEYNASETEMLNLFQIWVFTNKKNVEPRYQQRSLKDLQVENQLYQVLSPNKDGEGVWIHQDAWFTMGDLSAGWQGYYQVKKPGNGLFIMVIGGSMQIDDEDIEARDSIGIMEVKQVEIKAKVDSKLLIMEVPMN